MLPQSNLLILAPIAPGREQALRDLLATMNLRPGFADPENSLVPFGRLDRVHVARFMILEDPAHDDIRVYGIEPEPFVTSLAFLVDCDGSAEELIAELAARCEPGLRRLFACCQDFPAGSDLIAWMRAHRRPAVAAYVNWIGRTVRQVREEARLYDALSAYLDEKAGALAQSDLQSVRRQLVQFIDAQKQAGAITLTAPEPTPIGWWMRNALHAIAVPLVLIVASPLLLLYLPVFLWLLRRHETSDPEILSRPDPERRAAIAALEDHDITNPYIVMGYLKPGWFRLSTVLFLLWLVEYAARHIYGRGGLTRVRTIHFARWVFVNGRKQMFFASNYDGSLDSYMDDFINKVGWGLNVLFSNGVGYPRTSWLIRGGASVEQNFEYYLQSRQLPVQVWYKAYPGLSAFDLVRNSLIRKGLERPTMTDAEIREWLQLL
jgi:hypothetical protein